MNTLWKYILYTRRVYLNLKKVLIGGRWVKITVKVLITASLSAGYNMHIILLIFKLMINHYFHKNILSGTWFTVDCYAIKNKDIKTVININVKKIQKLIFERRD